MDIKDYTIYISPNKRSETKMLYTTINKLKEERACESGFKKVLKFVGSKFDRDEKIPLSDIIKSNDIDDAIWALRATTKCSKKVYQQVALFCAESSLGIYEKQYPDDSRVRDCIEATKKYINNEIELDELLKFRPAYTAADAADAYAADAAADAAAACTAAAAAAYAAAAYADYAAAAYADAADAYTAAYAAAYACAAACTAAYAAADARIEFKTRLSEKLLTLLGEHE